MKDALVCSRPIMKCASQFRMLVPSRACYRCENPWVLMVRNLDVLIACSRLGRSTWTA